MKKITAVLDIDGVLANFAKGVIELAHERNLEAYFPECHTKITNWGISDKFSELMSTEWSNPDFWLQLEPFEVTIPEELEVVAYLTARYIPSEVTKLWLQRNGFPDAEVISVSDPADKIDVLIRLRPDVFVDDYYPTVAEARSFGINAFLHWAPYQVGHESECAGLPLVHNLHEVVDKAFQPTVIGLNGVARSGKDTVGNYLVEKYGFTRLGFADGVRECLLALNPMVPVDGAGWMDLASAVDLLGWEALKNDADSGVRELLQRMGTEVGREKFGSEVWIDLAAKKTKGLDRIVFTDVRFMNELDFIRTFDKGYVFQIFRPGYESVNGHISDALLPSEFADGGIYNDGSIKELHTQIDSLLETIL